MGPEHPHVHVGHLRLLCNRSTLSPMWAQHSAPACLSWCILLGGDGLPSGICTTNKVLLLCFCHRMQREDEDEEAEAAAVPASSRSAAATRKQPSQQQDVREQLDRLLAKTREKSAGTKEADSRLRWDPQAPACPQQANPCACMHSRTCPMGPKQGWQSRAGVRLICCDLNCQHTCRGMHRRSLA